MYKNIYFCYVSAVFAHMMMVRGDVNEKNTEKKYNFTRKFNHGDLNLFWTQKTTSKWHVTQS